jgi:hypothetical protein
MEGKMKNKKDGRLFSFAIVLVICSSCVDVVLLPYHTTDYNNLELPVWTTGSGIWSLDDEKWLMRGVMKMRNKIRNNEIMNKYIIDGALCNVFLVAKNRNDPYGIYFMVYGLENIHISFTIKNIDISIKDGKNLSHLLNEDYSNKIFLESEKKVTGMLCWGHYHTAHCLTLNLTEGAGESHVKI